MHGLRELEYQYGCHMSDENQKIRTSFSEKHAPDFAAPVCHPSNFIDLANTLLAKRRSVKTICMVSGCDSTHMVGTSAVNSKQPRRFFWE